MQLEPDGSRNIACSAQSPVQSIMRIPMLSVEEKTANSFVTPGVLPNGNGGFTVSPEFLTEEELIVFLRIPEVSESKDYHNVIENLKRMHDLPRVHICGKLLYPLEAIRQWIREKTTNNK
jgi:hypothetical protein